MKRMLGLLIVILVLIAQTPSISAQDYAIIQDPASILLLQEDYNPFYMPAYPQDYFITSVQCDSYGDIWQYKIDFTTPNELDDVIVFYLSMLPEEDKTAENVETIKLIFAETDGNHGVIGTCSDCEFPMEAVISPENKEYSPPDNDRFQLEFKVALPADTIHNALAASILEIPFFTQIEAYLPLQSFGYAGFRVKPETNQTLFSYSYVVPDISGTMEALLLAYPEAYQPIEDELKWELNGMDIAISLDPDYGAVGVTVLINNFTIAAGDIPIP